MVGRKVFATRDGDGAKPRSIGCITVVAVAGEGVFCRRGRIAGDLLERECKILVECFGLVVVEGSEGREIQIGIRVVRHSIGSVSAEGEVVDDGAVAIWRGG